MTTEIQTASERVEFAVLKPEFQEVVQENYGEEGMQFDLTSLPTYVFPGAGGDKWVRKTPGLPEERPETFTGVVLSFRPNRTMYLGGYKSGSNDLPDCSSQDGNVGRVRTDEDGSPISNVVGGVAFGGDCHACPLNQWGSRSIVDGQYNGDGKACRESRVLLGLEPDRTRPVILRLPSTALKAWDALRGDLTDRSLGLSRAILELSLHPFDSGSTPDLHIKIVGEVPYEDSLVLKAQMPDIKRPNVLIAAASPSLSPEQEQAVADSVPF